MAEWISPDSAWWPKELRRLVHLLEVAHQGSQPGSGDPSFPGGRWQRHAKTTPGSGYPPGAVENDDDDTVEAAGDMQRSRRIVDKYAKRLGTIADELQSELRGHGKPKRGWQCPCGRFNAEWTRFCGICGHRRETIRVLRDESAGRDEDAG